MSLSMGLTVFNKWVFVPEGGNFPYVATLALLHMSSATVFTRVIHLARPSLFPAVIANAHIPVLQTLRMLIPLAVLAAMVLMLGNSAYLYLSVSYIQMIKAAMPAMTLILSAAASLDVVTAPKALLLVVLGLGIAGCSHGELLFSWKGFAFQMSSFVFEACRLIVMKLILAGEGVAKMDSLSLLFYLAPLNSLALVVPAALECRTIPLTTFYQLRFVFASNALVAFGLNVAGVGLMASVSVVTFTVCGLLKDLMLILGSTYIFGNLLTHEQIFCTAVVLVAAVSFQRIQSS
jgi:hypothetical protein